MRNKIEVILAQSLGTAKVLQAEGIMKAGDTKRGFDFAFKEAVTRVAKSLFKASFFLKVDSYLRYFYVTCKCEKGDSHYLVGLTDEMKDCAVVASFSGKDQPLPFIFIKLSGNPQKFKNN